MATRAAIITAIENSMNAISGAEQILGGDYMATKAKAKVEAVTAGYVFPMDDTTAHQYADDLRNAFCGAIVEVFETNDWRHEFAGAIADGILLEGTTSGFLTSSGSVGTLQKLGSSTNLVDSLVSESGSVVTVNGTLKVGSLSGLLKATAGTIAAVALLTVPDGGIGVGTLASNGVLYGNGTGAVQAVSVVTGSDKKFLTQSLSGVPAWNFISASDLPSGFSGLASVSGNIGLSAVPGSATTAARSDSLPPLSQAISPTWTAQHAFDKGFAFSDVTGTSAAGTILRSSADGIIVRGINGSANAFTLRAADNTIMMRNPQGTTGIAFDVPVGIGGPVPSSYNLLVTGYLGVTADSDLVGNVTTNGVFRTNKGDGIGVTSTDGLVLANSTLATSGAQQQYSPRLRFQGRGWKTSTSSNVAVDWREELRVQSGSSNPTTQLSWGYLIGGPSYTDMMILDSSLGLGLGTNSPNISGFNQAMTISTAQSASNEVAGLELRGKTTTVGNIVGSLYFYNQNTFCGAISSKNNDSSGLTGNIILTAVDGGGAATAATFSPTSASLPGTLLVGPTGTVNPNSNTANITISAGSSGNVDAILTFRGFRTSNNEFGGLQAYHGSVNVSDLLFVRDGADDAGAIYFQTKPTGGSLSNVVAFKSDGQVGIGTTSPQALLHVAGEGSVSNIIVQSSKNDVTNSVFELRKSRGSVASPTNVVNGDYFGSVAGAGWSGVTGWWSTSSVRFICDGAVTDNQRPPSGIELWVNASNAFPFRTTILDHTGLLTHSYKSKFTDTMFIGAGGAGSSFINFNGYVTSDPSAPSSRTGNMYVYDDGNLSPTLRFQYKDQSGTNHYGDFCLTPSSGGTTSMGALKVQKTFQNSNYTMLVSDCAVFMDTSGGNKTILLPPAIYMEGRLIIIIKQSASNTLTLNRSNSDTIKGGTSLAITAAGATWLQANIGDTNYYQIN